MSDNQTLMIEERPELAIPALPDTPTTKALEAVPSIDATARKQLSYRQFLDATELADARTEAEKEIVGMLGSAEVEANPAAIVTFASSAVDELKRTTANLIKQNSLVRVPQLDELMKNVRDRMRQSKNGYNMNIPEVRAKYEKMAGRKGWLRTKLFGAKTMLDMFFEDMRPFQGEVEKLESEVEEQMEIMLKYVSSYNELSVANDKAIRNLIYKIVVMENMIEIAQQQLESLPKLDGTSSATLRSQHLNISQFVTAMERKVTEYKTREILAEEMAPQILIQRGVTTSIAMNLGEVITLMLPVMSMTQFTLSGLLVAKQGSDLRNTVAEGVNEAININAELTGTLLPELAANAAQSTIAADTLYKQLEGVERATDGVIKALDIARADQAEKDAAILKIRERLTLSADKLTDAVLDDALRKRGTLGQIAHKD